MTAENFPTTMSNNQEYKPDLGPLEEQKEKTGVKSLIMNVSHVVEMGRLEMSISYKTDIYIPSILKLSMQRSHESNKKTTNLMKRSDAGQYQV
uniref:Uncharacterized protein n=1 Tax=Romanomermis culicivorax TaxID=13658 RepID=A0A915IFN7_ROMCU